MRSSQHLLVLICSLCVISTAESSDVNRKIPFAKSFASKGGSNSRFLESVGLTEQEPNNCDQALMKCFPIDRCSECFRVLYSEDIDWGTVTADTQCPRVVNMLANKGLCSSLEDDVDANDAFCEAFYSCAIAPTEEKNVDDDSPDGNDFIDCNELESCDWPGMHQSFIGDGICHEGAGGCYNSEICGFDGGDCCEDTCTSHDKNYISCGHDGYACKDPKSEFCDDSLSDHCENEGKDSSDDSSIDTCDDGSAMYRLVMYDSFGDGWDATKMTITPSERKNNIIFNGGLKDGSQGTEYICLSKAATCYNVVVSGGAWGNEVSWEVRPLKEGLPAVAGGAAPMDCNFSVRGAACETTCSGKPNVMPNVDPEYKEFKDMYNCIEDFCFIQVDTCEQDLTCSTCMEEEAPKFCYENEQFVALIDCTMCHCTDRKDSDYCQEKANPARPVPDPKREDEKEGGVKACSSAEVMHGSDALLEFGSCTDFDEVQMIVTDFDQDHFGAIDSFEACAHSYKNDKNHGGHTALGCLQILVNAMKLSDEPPDDDSLPTAAIAELAELIYEDGESFCDCAMKASDACPMCQHFIHFKTLLYESLDACQALDEIDCAAYEEFTQQCGPNLREAFDQIDFSDAKQCEYVRKGCGGAGPFPAFRRLDCDKEMKPDVWEHYKSYAKACMQDEPDRTFPTPGSGIIVPVPPTSTSRNVVPPPPVAPPVLPPTSDNRQPSPMPTPRPYIPWDGDGGKPYTPASSSEDTTVEKSSGKSNSHFFRNFVIVCLIAGAGYYVYQKRSSSFGFVRYRAARNYGGGESEMYGGSYTGLTTMEGSTSFEPPSLPPTPSAIDGTIT